MTEPHFCGQSITVLTQSNVFTYILVTQTHNRVNNKWLDLICRLFSNIARNKQLLYNISVLNLNLSNYGNNKLNYSHEFLDLFTIFKCFLTLDTKHLIDAHTNIAFISSNVPSDLLMKELSLFYEEMMISRILSVLFMITEQVNERTKTELQVFTFTSTFSL